MLNSQNINVQEDSDLKRIFELLLRNYKLILFCLIISLGTAFLINRYAHPVYDISASILIKEKTSIGGSGTQDYINSSLFRTNNNFQNELWVIKSTPVLEKTVSDLDLTVSYYTKGRFNFYNAYQKAPFKISYLSSHSQPVYVPFIITFLNDSSFQIIAESKLASFHNFETKLTTRQTPNWQFARYARFGELIETPDLAFIVELTDSTKKDFSQGGSYMFEIKTIASIRDEVKNNLNFSIIDKMATVIKISLRCESQLEGIDIVNELMQVYSDQNLERKNHIATITIDYIEKQLNEISDSLSRTEKNLQNFRSSNRLLNISDQATGVNSQYMNLQNQMAELVSRERYYSYVSDLLKNDNFSDLMLPSSMGISDQILTNLMGQLITAQTQRSNLIENKQERNPLVQKLSIQIENLKRTISENISAAGKTTQISIDEIEKRIKRIEAEIRNLPLTQRELGNIERKYRLNDAIYNYLMEKHAEAKITKASNLPDDTIIEPAMGNGQVLPNTRKNYLLAIVIGLTLPMGYLMLRLSLNNKIGTQDDIERITDRPVLGKILHNTTKTTNVMFEFPNSNIAESFRALRTNLDFYVRVGQKKVIMVTSCFENEGKSFVSLNLAMSYAQLGRRTILVDFDLRKRKSYFKKEEESMVGLSSYMINQTDLADIILKSPNEKLDYIPAGLLPPNPVELIALEKTEKLLTQLKENYEVIILDTTPLAQVTDAYLLMDRAEVKLIVIRQNSTLKNVFSLIMKDLQNKKVDDVCLAVNDNRFAYDQYGYGYGYYNKKSFFNKRVKKHKRRTV